MGNSNKFRINHFFSNLNVIVILIGYPLITSIFIPLLGNQDIATRTVTIPFRIFALGITLITLFLNFKSKTRLPLPLKIFFLFWILFLLRMLYDLEISTEYFIPPQFKQQVWLVAIAICFIPMFSLAKSISKIDFNLVLKYIFVACNIILIISLFTAIRDTSEYVRVEANPALNSIELGQFAITATIISLYRFITGENNSLKNRVIYIIIALLGVYVALRTGSRGPIVGLILVLSFWYSLKEKKISKSFFKFSSLVLIILVFKNYILQLFGSISPIIALRIFAAIKGKDNSVLYREESYNWFFNRFLEHPLYGSHFARLQNGFYPGYAHNIFLDIMLGLGVLGLGLFLYVLIKAFINVRKHIISKNNYWVGLIMMQVFFLSLSSGAFYANPVLNCMFVLTLMLPQKRELKMSNLVLAEKG